MRMRVLFPIVALAAFAMSSQDAQAFELLNRMMGRGHGCCAVEPTCCEAPACCEPTCCAAPACEPSCYAEPTCCEEPVCCETSCCQRRRPVLALLRRIFHRHNHCCEIDCCEPSCYAEPTCCGH